MILNLQPPHIERLAALARVLLAVLLTVWLASVLVNTFWLAFSGPQDVPDADPSQRRLQAVAQRDLGSLALTQVEAWRFFGVPPEAPEQRVVDAPDTSLRLELVGLFMHSDPARASAIIAEQGRDAMLYRPGDKIPGNAELNEVLGDRVILRRQGRLEALRLKELTLGAGVVAGRTPSRAPDPAPPATAENTVPDGDPAQQRAMIIEQLGLEPVTEGAAEGYRIQPSASASVLASVGLRPGDQILTVNGHALGEEQGDLNAMQDAMAAGSASIEVQRGSRRFTVNYPP
ncbi:type II secretion system protein N [Isoalcanivorax beigongshangi]|uniref:Type II secretion system protein N n=1 Tax=Isoalcanivorax beigongshangi TaxID=3238810 RepID=A0ABV4AK77_9GAMM